jgi:iron complex outermembrane receptor protein
LRIGWRDDALAAIRGCPVRAARLGMTTRMPVPRPAARPRWRTVAGACTVALTACALLPRPLPAAAAPPSAPAPVALPAAAPVPPAGPVAPAAPATAAKTPAADETVVLDRVDVQARPDDKGFDSTGMGSYEHQLRDPAFSNDMISADAIEDDAAALELVHELAHIATPAAVDLATGDSRVGLRGFPTPLLTNGFVRMGGIDVLNTARTVIIQGALVPVLGRGAPGGIQDYWTNRPRTARSQRFDYTVTDLQRQSALVELHGLAVPKRAWHRIAADWSRKEGPETHAASDVRSVNGALTWRHGPAASTLFSVDYTQTHATAAPAIPEYRVAAGQKIVGPWLPLAGFNALGPEAGVRRRSVVGNIIVDAQPHPKLALRAGLETWWRRIEQDRFTNGLLNLATRRFEGTREPLHSEQPQTAHVGRIELTGRFSLRRTEHKLMLALGHTVATYERFERALAVADRNALPASVRIFDPAAPDYSRPAYSPARYNRILTDRRERTRYTAVEVSERIGFDRGRTVVTSGLRRDFVGLKLHDRRAGLAPHLAHVADTVGELTWHTGVNYQAIPSRLLLFATTSTAFNPSTRVDARTGRIQGNETTGGHEVGAKLRFAERKIDVTTSFFTFANQDISRRNPLYGDPVQDANHTQPQLVAAGEERYTGGKIEGSWRLRPTLTVTFRGSYVRAVTTASPDLPEEVGRELTRFPPYNLGVAASYGFPAGKLKGLSLSGTWAYISGFIAAYEDRVRYRLDYPGYATTAVSASYPVRRGKFTHTTAVSVRNVFATDLLAKLHRLGAGREVSATYRLMW